MAFKGLRSSLNNAYAREDFVKREIQSLPIASRLLDAGCGDQKYKKYCTDLEYLAQDFAQYTVDKKEMLGSKGIGGANGYQYGALNYVGNIWEINETNQFFDAILCTEVLEHIPFPVETIREFSRILKPNGKLILTAPSNCLRHMDPFYYSSGFSDRWYEHVLPMFQFEIESISPVGDYYRWMAVEIFRTFKIHKFASLILLPTFFYYIFKRKTHISENTLCMGYHVVAVKKS